MKLIIAGASGFVGSELVRQALTHPSISEVVAISRTPVSAADQSTSAKLTSVVVDDYNSYSDQARKAFQGTDACIWCVAITPTKSKNVDFAIVKKVCQDDTLAGLRAMSESQLSVPFRFLYISGLAAERDPNKTPFFMPEYCWMRGETENQVLAFAAQQNNKFEACVAKPGIIFDSTDAEKTARAEELMRTAQIPSISVSELCVALIGQCLDGFEKEPLLHEDLQRLGK